MTDSIQAKTILVVEDESIIAMDIQNSLRHLGYQTPVAVHNARDAIEAAGRLSPDLILMDIFLQGEMDGIEAAVIITNRFNIPIVYLTANTDEKTFERAKISTPFGYLLKPFDERELHTTIETALYKHKTEQELRRYRDHLEELVRERTAQLETTHQALRESEENYRTIFNSVNDTIVVIECESGRILDVNEKNRELTGYSPEETKELTIGDLERRVPPYTLTDALAHIGRAMAGEPQVFEWQAKRRDDTLFWIEVSLKAAPIGGQRRVLGVLRDISVRKEAEEMLIKAKENAEAANRLKSQFLANMSHEIRTPMNAVLGMTRVTLETDLNPAQRRYLEMVREAGENLLYLLNDILDYSKLESDQVTLDHQPFDLRLIIEDSARSLATQAYGKGLELICQPPPIAQLPCNLIGDGNRLRQILLNLLGNAIKFTAKGHILLQAQVLTESDGEMELLISVSDTGIGIPAAKQAGIFDRFSQVDPSLTRNFGGAGLGLAITRKLAQLMGGEIWIDSEEGKGSTFSLSLRLPKGGQLREESLDAIKHLTGTPTLVIDRNAQRRELLSELFNEFGLCAQTVAGLDEGLTLMTGQPDGSPPPELVCLDFDTQAFDPILVHRRLLAARDNRLTRIILLLPPAAGDASKLYQESDLFFCLDKPVTRSRLLALLQHAFARQQSNDAKPTARIINFPRPTTVRILLADSNPFSQELLGTALEEQGYAVLTAATGHEVLETLSREPVDVIFMDLELADINGVQATDRIRRYERQSSEESDLPQELCHRLAKRLTGGRVPIVALAPPTAAETRTKCLAAGMDDYLTKPVKLDQALTVIARLLSMHH